MSKINEILKIDLSEEFHGVVDLDSQEESKIKEEIESFILTEPLAKHMQDFCSEYNTGSQHSGVWISGFYGSGKSFFAKMLGFLLQNPDVVGTPMRTRFLSKLTGLKNEQLLANEISAFGKQQNHVILFDSAKKNNAHGTSFLLFGNFLRSLQLLDNKYGLIEFDMYLNGEYESFKQAALQETGKPWEETRSNLLTMSTVFRKALNAQGMSDKIIDEIIASAEEKLNTYDATKLREDLDRYLLRYPDQRVVFLIDEVSEAIEQQKINLLDLEGIAEALADMGRKVWTICIAQQRLDDVINASNITRGLLTKLIDRFRTRIEIKAEEVDTIIRSRLLSKTDSGTSQLGEYYRKNSGLVQDITDIKGTGLEKTISEDVYVDYFPFYKHQFKLLQYFLFGSGANVQTKIGTRGMLISAYDVLRKEVQKANPTDINYHVNAQQLCQQAELSEDEAMRIRYEQADNQLREISFKYISSGKSLLQTIHFLFKASAMTTVENIAKAYVNKPDDYHAVLAEVKNALEVLVQHDVLILNGNQYRITNQTEQRIIEEKKKHENEMPEYRIKSEIKKALKNLSIIRDIQQVDSIKFNISCDGEPFANPNEKYLKVEFHDILNVRHSGMDIYVNQIKNSTQNDKDKISIVPTPDESDAIMRLVKDIEGTNYIISLPNQTPEEKAITASIASDLDTKQSQLNQLLEKAYKEGQAIYCYNTYHLSENYVNTLHSIQRTTFSNIFTRKLNAELSDTIAKGIFQKGPTEWQKYIGNGEKDFIFFDTIGNFIGTGLSVTTEILEQAKTFITGKDLVERLAAPPTGFSYGTVISSTAALFRGGLLISKYNGTDFTSPNQLGAQDIFSNSRTFEKASFKGISTSLNLSERKEIIDCLKDCNYKQWTGHNLSYTMNDFDAVDAVRDLASTLRTAVNMQIMGDNKLESLFPSSVQGANDVLSQYTTKVTEVNCISQARKFLQEQDEFVRTVDRITSDLDFIQNKLTHIRINESYAEEVKREFEATKLGTHAFNDEYQKLTQSISSNVVANYKTIIDATQKIRDFYVGTFKEQAGKMSEAYFQLQKEAEKIAEKLTPYVQFNGEAAQKVDSAISACKKLQIAISSVHFQEGKTICDTWYKSLRDIMHALENAQTMKVNLAVIETSIITQAPTIPTPKPGQPDVPVKPKPITRKLRSQLPKGSISKADYKQWLTNQLQMLNSFADDDTITFNE